MPKAIRNSKAVISVSEATTKDLLEKFPECSKKFTTIPLGVNEPMSRSNLGSDYVLMPKKPYILFVGTLEPRKNLNGLIEAFALAVKSISADINLVIVGGSGWGGINPREIAVKLGVGDRVIILGYVSEAQLHNFYKEAIFLAIPSLYEGFGLPILEAMSYGLPILTSNNSSMPEVAGNAAILVNPKDINSIANGIINLVLNKGLRDALSASGVEISKKYSWDRTARETDACFKKVFHEN